MELGRDCSRLVFHKLSPIWGAKFGVFARELSSLSQAQSL
jgi:hypothetical protein